MRREALWQAAELYEKAERSPANPQLYANYVKQFPSPLDPAMDARQKLADMARRRTTSRRATQWNETSSCGRAAGAARTDRSKYLAAKATLEVAEPAGAMFNAIKLVAPLDKIAEAQEATRWRRC